MKSEKLFHFNLVLLFVVSLLALLISLGLLGYKYADDARGENSYELLRQAVLDSNPLIKGQMDEDILLPTIEEDTLKQLNPSYAAWIYIPETPVCYPVVYPESNSDYLNMTFEREKRACGSLFFDSGTEPLSSLNTVIHGHNMRSGSMFGSLKQYLTPDYAKIRKQMYINMSGTWKTFRLLAVYCVENTDSFPYRISFFSQRDWESYVNGVLEKSEYDTGVELEQVETILTLSTCYGKDRKLIVQWAEEKEGL